MEHAILHACGHQQVHVLYGFDAQVARKARWLRTTQCRACFVAAKQVEQAKAAADAQATIAHLDLAVLIGSDRQIAWATTIRTERLAALIADPETRADDRCELCLGITDAKWWIDHRSLLHQDLLAKAHELVGMPLDGAACRGCVIAPLI